jgi:hypothetical protein
MAGGARDVRLVSLRRAAALVALTAAPGCSLVVGDIELPPAQVGLDDAGGVRRDAGTDAASGGTAVPPDAAPPPGDTAIGPTPDAAPPPPPDATAPPPGDAWVAPPDSIAPPPPDAAPPEPDVPVAPPPDLSAIAGYWYVDGFGPQAGGEVGAYAAAMRVERNHADLLTNEGELVNAEISLVPAPDLYGTWLLTHPISGVVYRGAFAPTSGFAVFVPDDRAGGAAMPASVILMAKANEEVPAVPADALAYTRIGRLPARGDGEVGTLRKTRDDAYMQEARYAAPPLNIQPDRELGFWNIDPWRYTLYDASSGAEVELVPTSSGMGAIGVERTPEAGGVALMLGWTLRAPGGLPRVGDLFCAGLTWDRMGGMQPQALPATLSDDGTLQWAGGFSQRLSDIGGLYQLEGGLNPFGLDGAVAIGDADDELLIVLPLDPGPDNVQAVWGLMACVRTDLVPFPI